MLDSFHTGKKMQPDQLTKQMGLTCCLTHPNEPQGICLAMDPNE